MKTKLGETIIGNKQIANWEHFAQFHVIVVKSLPFYYPTFYTSQANLLSSQQAAEYY